MGAPCQCPSVTELSRAVVVGVLVLLVALHRGPVSVQGRSLPNHHASYKRLKHARIGAIQHDLLSRLMLRRPPHPPTPTNASQLEATVAEQRRVLRLYRRSVQELQGRQHSLYEDKEYLAKEFHSFTDQGSHPEGTNATEWHSKDESTIRLHFKVNIPQPRDPNREKVTHSASLKVYKSAVHPENLALTSTIDLVYRINIYQLLEPVVNPTHQPLRRLLDSKLVSLESTDWESFNIRNAVESWMEDPSTNYGLEISGEDEAMSRVLDFVTHESVVGDDMLADELTPHLDVFTQTRQILSGRQKRSEHQLDCKQGDGQKNCCRFPLWISFEDIGWNDWIVYPSGFQAYFCDGSCPHRYKSAHAFSEIKSFINQINSAAAPAPCCTATKLSPLPLVHYNEDNLLVISSFEDMIVEECKCA